MTSRLRLLTLVALTLVLALTAPVRAAAQRTFSFGYDQPHSTAYGIALTSSMPSSRS